ncbi:hypothetical protein BDV12DRAFT_201126 [Aspergillus spectabilis]
MSESTSHKIFSIFELVEAILLEADARTLLTAAPRVCRHWNGIITNSHDLQAALFLTPTKRWPHGRPQQMNPFLERLWQEFFRRSNPPCSENSIPLDPIREKAYLRRDASWRRMLPHQPPASRVRIVGHEYRDRRWHFSETTEITVSLDETGLRLGQFHSQIEELMFVPSKYLAVLWEWEQSSYWEQFKRTYGKDRAMATSQYFKSCDAVLYSFEYHAARERVANRKGVEERLPLLIAS